jgi:hypothetical protein
MRQKYKEMHCSHVSERKEKKAHAKAGKQIGTLLLRLRKNI